MCPQVTLRDMDTEFSLPRIGREASWGPSDDDILGYILLHFLPQIHTPISYFWTFLLH